MMGKKNRSDFRLIVARYQIQRNVPPAPPEERETVEHETVERETLDLDTVEQETLERETVERETVERDTRERERERERGTAGQSMMEARSQYVEMAIQQAIRRGEFNDLPGTGKPLPNLDRGYDPDWWIRRKIEREKITGLGPAALTLRTENAALEERLDRAPTEAAVTGILTDFNARVVAARRQLQGGPPVVTPTRDVGDEVTLWRQRRTARSETARMEREQQAEALAGLTWRARRRARRLTG